MVAQKQRNAGCQTALSLLALWCLEEHFSPLHDTWALLLSRCFPPLPMSLCVLRQTFTNLQSCFFNFILHGAAKANIIKLIFYNCSQDMASNSLVSFGMVYDLGPCLLLQPCSHHLPPDLHPFSYTLCSSNHSLSLLLLLTSPYLAVSFLTSPSILLSPTLPWRVSFECLFLQKDFSWPQRLGFTIMHYRALYFLKSIYWKDSWITVY